MIETLRDTEVSPKDTTHLFVEWGHSRTAIAARVQNATSRLALFSSVQHPIAGTETIPFPRLSPSEPFAAANAALRAYDIDAFWPQDSARYDLTALDAEVHTAAAPEVIRLVDDKVAFNEWLGDDPYRPLAVETTGADDLAGQIERLQDEGHDICVKPVIGVGGNGYWRLHEALGTSLFLNKPEKRTIHPATYLNALSLEEAQTGPQRMMLMDYLPGPEVSVDLLTWRGEPLIHAARTKEDFATSQLIQSEHEVIEHSHAIAKKLGFHGIVSLQYRLDAQGNWKMLEINPRPAGGSIYSEDGGFGIISNWAKLVTKEIGPEDIHQHHGETTVKKR